MESKLRGRVIFILVIIVIAVLGIIGFPRNFKELKDNVHNRIRFGLDLKGGTYMVLQVHVEDAVNVTTDQTRERLTDEFQAHNIPFASMEKVDSTHIMIKGIPPNKLPDVQNLVNDQFSDWILAQVPGDLSSRELAMKTTVAAGIRTQALAQSMYTIRNRVDRYGVAEFDISEYGQGENELVVQLPGVDDPSRVQNIMQTSAMLTWRLVHDNPYPSKEAAMAAHGGVLPPNTEVLPGKPDSSSGGTGEVWYIVDQVPAVTGRDLTGAEPSHDERGRPSISFTLNRDGATRFSRITGANIGKQLAIVLDNRVVSAPTIQGQISDRGEITGTFTQEQAQDLALVLNSGALPASVTPAMESTVGPSLGADSVRHGIASAIAGLIAVMGFMLIYYRGAGINADIALILNLLLLVSGLAYFGGTLTVPGIAGVILTVGMGVDSNVLIFERIREELRNGKAVGAAVAGGFEHAFITIIDTHVTTVVSAAILFTFGTGPVKGFAVTLVIGLVANLFTSVFVSRTIFEFILARRKSGEALSI
jgi:preprotein translocase subunit SecD